MICTLPPTRSSAQASTCVGSIGPIGFSIESPLDDVIDYFVDQYGAEPNTAGSVRGESMRHEPGREGPMRDGLVRGGNSASFDACRIIRLSVRPVRTSGWAKTRYQIETNAVSLGPPRRRSELIPFLEWSLNNAVANTRDDFFQIHAATMVRDGGALLLPASSGAGKSTLAAALMLRGWQYACDEFALIDPATLHVHPFPKALCLKEGSFPTCRVLGIDHRRYCVYLPTLKQRVAYVSPRSIAAIRDRTRDGSFETAGSSATVGSTESARRAESIGAAGPAPVRTIIFPRYSGAEQPHAYRMSASEAAFVLMSCGVNRSAFTAGGVPIVTRLVRGAACVRMETGDIHETCDLIESIVDA